MLGDELERVSGDELERVNVRVFVPLSLVRALCEPFRARRPAPGFGRAARRNGAKLRRNPSMSLPKRDPLIEITLISSEKRLQLST